MVCDKVKWTQTNESKYKTTDDVQEVEVSLSQKNDNSPQVELLVWYNLNENHSKFVFKYVEIDKLTLKCM